MLIVYISLSYFVVFIGEWYKIFGAKKGFKLIEMKLVAWFVLAYCALNIANVEAGESEHIEWLA